MSTPDGPPGAGGEDAPGGTPEPGALQVRVEELDLVTVVTVAGEVDLFTTAWLREPFRDVAARGGDRPVVLDLTAVPFIDSAGLGHLVALYKRLQEQQRPLHLVGVSPRVLRPLEIMGLDRVFRLDATLDDALGALRRTP